MVRQVAARVEAHAVLLAGLAEVRKSCVVTHEPDAGSVAIRLPAGAVINLRLTNVRGAASRGPRQCALN